MRTLKGYLRENEAATGQDRIDTVADLYAFASQNIDFIKSHPKLLAAMQDKLIEFAEHWPEAADFFETFELSFHEVLVQCLRRERSKLHEPFPLQGTITGLPLGARGQYELHFV